MSVTGIWRWILRRGVLVILAMLVVALVGAFGVSNKAVKYKAEARLTVPSGANGKTPGSAQEAAALAANYTELIPQDDAIIDAAANSLTLTRDQVRSDLSVTTAGTTSLIHLTFTATTPTRAVDGMSDIVTAILSGESTTVPQGTVQEITAPSVNDVSTLRSLTQAERALVGALIGLVLGLLFGWAWDRHDRRIDTAEDLQALLVGPVTELDQLTQWNIRALQRGWTDRTGVPNLTVTIVTPTTRVKDPTSDLETAFCDLGLAVPFEVTRWRAEVPATRAQQGRLLLGGRIGADESFAATLSADFVVLCAAAGTPERDVVRSLDFLRQHDIEVAWGLVVGKSFRRWVKQARATKTEAVIAPVAEPGAPAPAPTRASVRAVEPTPRPQAAATRPQAVARVETSSPVQPTGTEAAPAPRPAKTRTPRQPAKTTPARASASVAAPAQAKSTVTVTTAVMSAAVATPDAAEDGKPPSLLSVLSGAWTSPRFVAEEGADPGRRG